MDKKILGVLVCVIFGMFGFCYYAGAESVKEYDTEAKVQEAEVIEDVEQFSGISKKELKEIMGKPASKETWISKTEKGDFKLTSFLYDKKSNHYEFVIADGKVVRLTIYSDNYWNGKGDRFKIGDGIESTYKSYGITLGGNVKEKANTAYAYVIAAVNDKVDKFHILDINSETNTYGMVKITYNLDYFES